MERENYYKMYPEYKFAIVKFQSEILTIEEAERINYEYKINPLYSQIEKLLVIIDEDSTPQFAIKDIDKLSSFYNNELQDNNHKDVVWLVSAPLITALAHIFMSQTNDNSQYCSTIVRAYELLKTTMDYTIFEKLINEY